MEEQALFLKFLPRICHDLKEPFPVRFIGCTAFRAPARSSSFPKWFITPQPGQTVLEYAVYYDYDIQHLYDLEHIWVAVDRQGQVRDCWSSFHGMRLRAWGVPGFRLEDGTHPVLYSQPGKHAMLPDPKLFSLHPQFETACTEHAGGGVLVPGLLEGRISTDPGRDEAVCRHIRDRFSFTPSGSYLPQEITGEQLLSWEELLERIPRLMEHQLRIIENT